MDDLLTWTCLETPSPGRSDLVPIYILIVKQKVHSSGAFLYALHYLESPENIT